jgi:AcrR family transcriptional regulator
VTTGLSDRQVAKRGQIASAARKLFLEQGYAATSMDALAAEAGVSKQTLYVYFPTKLDLLRAILEDEVTAISAGDTRSPEIHSLEDLRTLLLGFAERLAHTLLLPDTVSVIRLTLGEAFRIPELRETLRNALPVRALHRFAALIADANDQGLISAPDADLAARMLLGPIMTYVAIDGFLTTGDVVQPSPEKLRRIVDYFLVMVQVAP